MIFFALIIGVVLIVAAIRNSQGALFAALGQDVPAFVVWAAAIFALGAIGFIPNLRPVSRGLLALVLVVLVIRNYKQILSGFQNAWQHPPAYVAGDTTPGTPATAPASTSAQPAPNVGSIASGAAHYLDLFGGNAPAATGTTGAF